MKTKCICRSLVSLFMVIVLTVSLVPVALASQDPTYHDPAEHWIEAGSRTNELDANAIVTHETFRCSVCEKQTSFLIWRVPEYTRDGKSALTRNVLYSDGTMVDGKSTGVILDGTPGVDAFYTGYHWTKSMCENCGTTGSNGGIYDYGFSKNVYSLYDCAAEFMESLPETVTYEEVDAGNHRVTTKTGEYCVFCFGTRYSENVRLESHTLRSEVLPQPANGRFATVNRCADCGYTDYDYTAAKAVVANYYGTADGQPHTITVTDLSEGGVAVNIRYGNSANACTMATAPTYTQAGQYTVYYEITYTFKDKTMSENGAAYVVLRDGIVNDDGNGKLTCGCGCGDPDCGCEKKNCNGDCEKDKGCGENHKFVLLETVEPGCLTLGYDRYLCTECGKIEKRDYVAALGHDFQSVIIREATCEADGKMLEVCSRCGQMMTSATPKGEHKYTSRNVAATCTSPGYTLKECSVCGDTHIINITAALPHNYQAHVTAATCVTGGRTVHLCDGCGSSFVTDYTDPLGHQWDEGTLISSATCVGSGVIEHHCLRCGATQLEGDPAKGHTPGAPATCTQPQTCTKCGAIITPALGHSYKADVTPSTCTKMGWATFTCTKCGDTYKSEYTDALGHEYVPTVTKPTCTDKGYTTYTCSRCGDSYVDDYTDALDHVWDDGTKIADASCTGEGVMQYRCYRCGETYLEAVNAKGHAPGAPATCTEPQTCTRCGAIITPALGHQYTDKVTPPTCTEMGYTTHTCDRCGDSYKDNYTAPTGHKAGDWIVDREPTMDAEGERHKECENCGERMETERMDRLNDRDITDNHGEAEVGGYLVIVTDTDTENPIMGAVVTLNKDNTLSVRLPDGRLLDYADQTTVTVLVKADRSAVSGVDIAVTDANDNYSADTTDKAGQITVPGTSGKTNDSGRVTVGGEDEDDDRYTLTVKVEDYESGRPIKDADVTIDKNGKIGVVLPDGVDMDEQNRIKVTVTDHKGVPQKGLDVTVRNDMGRTGSGKTDEKGVIVVPEPEIEAVEHCAYIYGYPNGTFGPGNSMTRSEAAAIFARLLASKRGDILYDNVHSSFTDVSGKAWYASAVKYLETLKIISGYEDGSFRPDAPITRSEFVAMAVRFYTAYGVEETGRPETGDAMPFPDVSSTNWAADYIRQAAANGWVLGYEDGTFGGDNYITRAEVVTIVNRVLGREADREYISANLGRLNSFPDMPTQHWAYYAVMEAANSHTAPETGAERWLEK